MKKDVDYIYEYSDLNLLQTRVKVLTGDYSEIIFEFSNAYMVQRSDKSGGMLNFDYTIYNKPDNLKDVLLRGQEKFEIFVSDIIINISQDRKNDIFEIHRTREAAANRAKVSSKIIINKKFYLKNIN